MTGVGNWFNSGGMEQWVSEDFQNKSGETFKRGELLFLDATPELIKVPTTSLVGDAAHKQFDVSEALGAAARLLKLFGIAMKDAPATGQITIPVFVLKPGSLVEANLVTGTDGNPPTTLVSLVAHKGVACGILHDGTNNRWYFTAAAAEKCVEIVKIGIGITGDALSGGGIGDSNVRAQGIIHPDVIRYQTESA
jgi:hypothetical protein